MAIFVTFVKSFYLFATKLISIVGEMPVLLWIKNNDCLRPSVAYKKLVPGHSFASRMWNHTVISSSFLLSHPPGLRPKPPIFSM